MKKFVSFIIFICLTLMFTNAVFADSSYVKTIYNEQNGLPTGEANAVLRTSDGYMWIGSYGGLIRFDGTNFRNFSTDGLISSSSIRSLFEDSQKRLWVGTNDAGVFLYENGKFTQIESPGNYSFLCIRDFAESPDGTVHIASTSGIGEINGNKLIPYEGAGITGETAYSIACDPSGRVWAALNAGKCAVITDGKPERIIESSEIFTDAEIYCAASDDMGNILLGSSENKAARLSFDDNGEYRCEIFETGDVYTHNRIISKAGQMIICGEQGFALLDENGDVVLTNGDTPIPANDAAVDYEGNIWLASSTYGAVKYAKGCISPVCEDTEFMNTAINAVAISDGNYYAAHDSGLFIVNSAGEVVNSPLCEMLSGIRVRHAMTDDTGKVWLSTYSDHGIVVYDPKSGNTTEFNTQNGLISNLVRMTLQIAPNKFAAATQSGVNIIENGEVTESYGSKDGLNVSAILCLAYDPDGTLLMGSDGGGLFTLKDGVISSHGLEEALEEGVVLRLLRDEELGGYFVSAGSNLYYWNKSEFTKLTGFNKDAGSIFDFFIREGKLYVLQNNGIIELDKAALLSGNYTRGREFSFAHGLTGSLNANTWSLQDNDKLYIATRKGVSLFEFDLAQSELPKVIINSIVIDGEEAEKTDNLSISGNAGRVTFDFSALCFSGNSDFVLSYKLEGFDDEETVVSSFSENVSYTNLPGGEYTFTVKAYSPGDPSHYRTASITVTKTKRIYEYPLFWILSAVILLAAAAIATYLILSARLRASKRRQKELKNIIEQSLSTFAEAIDAKDKYTQGHSLRVAAYSRELALRMGLPEEEQERIYYIAFLHDIGKIGIPDSILNKPDKLTPEEDAIIRTHPIIGGRILENFTAIKGITAGAKYHHERLDGNGYCEGLKGDQIPLEARIIGVADTYDAMSSTRCYRKAMPSEVIIEELTKISGTQLDPVVVKHMLDMIQDGTAPMETVSKLHNIVHTK